jgi:hypothetical protein
MSKKTKSKAVRQKRDAEKSPRVDKKPHMTSHHDLKNKKSSSEIRMTKEAWFEIGLKAGWINVKDSSN